MEITAGDEYIPELSAKVKSGSYVSIADLRCSSDTFSLWRARSKA